jgi:hypothetical protein
MKRFTLFVLLVLCISFGGIMTATNAQSAACASLEHRQFDFWVGEWDVFDYISGQKGASAGTNLITKEFNSCVIQEHWTGSQGGRGGSFNTYQPFEKKWHQVWVDDGGTFLHLTGEFKDGAMVLAGDHPGQNPGVRVTERITWNLVNNDPDQVRQLWQQSTDGGNTWSVAFDGLYIRKK